MIGTAGWAISAGERTTFPSDGTALQRYASVLPCVEVNSSFHRPHRRSTWERWAASVPDGFRFAVKIPKEVSHVQRLASPSERLEQFFQEVAGLGDKLAVVLLQLPPSFAFDAGLLCSFLNVAFSMTDAQIVCEPRHESWFSLKADTLLDERQIARVAADPAMSAVAAAPGGWRGLSYRRLHGSPVMYRSSYGEERLQAYADMMAADRRSGRPSWCMFDNTASSAALGDALELLRLEGSAMPPSGRDVEGVTAPQ